MDMPKPGPAVQALSIMLGSWRGEDVIHPTPWNAEGGRADAVMVNRPGPGGFTVVQDITQTRDGAEIFAGHGILWWDGAAGEYVLDWVDSIGMLPSRSRGRLEGGRLVLTGSGPQGVNRLSWDFGQAGRCRFSLEISADGEAFSAMIEGDYAREAADA